MSGGNEMKHSGVYFAELGLAAAGKDKDNPKSFKGYQVWDRLDGRPMLKSEFRGGSREWDYSIKMSKQLGYVMEINGRLIPAPVATMQRILNVEHVTRLQHPKGYWDLSPAQLKELYKRKMEHVRYGRRHTVKRSVKARQLGINRRTQLRWEQVNHLTAVNSRTYRTKKGEMRRRSNEYFLFGEINEVPIQIMSHKEPVNALDTRGKQSKTGKTGDVSDLSASKNLLDASNLGFDSPPPKNGRCNALTGQNLCSQPGYAAFQGRCSQAHQAPAEPLWKQAERKRKQTGMLDRI